MKNSLFLLIFMLATFPAIAQQLRPPAMIPTYFADWKQIDSFAARGLYKSALDRVETVYVRAKADANFPQLIRASLQRAVFSTFLDDDAYPRLVASLQADVAQSPESAKAVLNSVLGEVVWQYYRQNRYRLMNRATLADDTKPTPDKASSPDNDIRTWDANRLVGVTTDAYINSLRAEKTLLATPIGSFSAVIDRGDATATALRPTLFDLLAHRAIGFFQDTEADISRPVFRFTLDQPAYFADAAGFANQTLDSRDSLSGLFLALRTYQRLLTVHAHLTGTSPSALADADLARLQFVHQYFIANTGAETDKEILYREALERAMKLRRGQSAEAIYGFALAQALAEAGNAYQPFSNETPKLFRKQAADLCRDLVARYPETMAGKNAAVLLANLLNSELSVNVEDVTAPDEPFRALVTYRNLPTLHCRVMKLDSNESDGSYFETDAQRVAWLTKLNKRAPATQGITTLPDDGDLQTHRTEIGLSGLGFGRYVLLISADAQFTPESKRLEYALFQVSRMGYLVDSYRNDATITYLLTDRITGQPLASRPVQVFRQKNRGKDALLTDGKTDAQGRFVLQSASLARYESIYVVFGKGADQLTIMGNSPSYYRNDQPENPGLYLKLFTDRAIYRPGQIVYVKGLLFTGKQNSFSVVAGQSVEVRLQDANGEQVTKQTFKTNEFGTFNGSFVAPVGRLTGRMTLETGIDQGQVSIQVEEYKRPTFEVVAAPVAGSYKLGQPVSVSATAKTYAGAVVDGASVRYRITRQHQTNWWDRYAWWRRPVRRSTPQEIGSGTLTTNAQGVAGLTFMATPDLSIVRADNPTFEFAVTFDVTDQSGETRSTTQTVRVGYSALQIQVVIPAVIDVSQPQKPIPVTVENRAGEAVAATTNIVISRLTTPVHPLRPRLWDRPDKFVLTRAEFERQFPNDLYDNDLDPTTWAKTEVAVARVETRDSNKATPDSVNSGFHPRYFTNLPPGQYVADITATGPNAETATQQTYFAIVNEVQPLPVGRPGLSVKLDKATYQPGESATLTIGDGLDASRAHYLLQVYEKGKSVREEWLTATVNQPLRVVLPIAERDRGGFAVRVSGVRRGRFESQTQTLAVPFTNKELTVETLTFRDKLKPGQAETWTLRVSGPGQENAAAEMVASLYDASLDAFVPLYWPTSFYQETGYAGNSYQAGNFDDRETYPLFYAYNDNDGGDFKSLRYDALSWGRYEFSGYGNRLFRTRRAPNQDLFTIRIQRNGDRITGTVRNQAGDGVRSVSVRQKSALTGVLSDAAGVFSLTLLNTLKATMVFSMADYQRLEVKLSMRKNQLARLLPNEIMIQKMDFMENDVAISRGGRGLEGRVAGMAMTAAPMADPGSLKYMRSRDAGDAESKSEAALSQEPTEPNAAPKPVTQPAPQIRKNFNETAFFLPDLRTDAEGRVLLTFTMPEALTRWRLRTFAHTKDLKTGTLDRDIITQKELMITTNLPRFFREGDTIRIAARINNLTDKALTGTAKLEILDALTGEALPHPNPPPKAGEGLNNPGLQAPLPTGREWSGVSFSALAGASTAVFWTLPIPTDCPPLTIRVSATAGEGLITRFTDAEERTVPVLPNRMLVTETMPIWVNGNEKKTFTLDALAKLSPELPVQHERLTVEVTANPIWYALQSLPGVLEYPYECAEQLFSRVYGSSLAAYIVNARPEFRTVIEGWKTSPPRNPLETNAELKAVTLENTPWVADARAEADRTAKLGQLFDANNLRNMEAQSLAKLKQLQTPDGGFRWFPGLPASPTITLHLLAGFGHLAKLGVRLPDGLQADVDAMMTRAIAYADTEMLRHVRDSKGQNPGSYWAMQYGYARSFYLKMPVPADIQKPMMVALAGNWLNATLQGQAMTALTLNRFGDAVTARQIMASLRERATTTDEMGMYWPENKAGTFWYQAPVETQALLIETFGELPGLQPREIDHLKQWLIRQKQTQSWPSTKATTEAVYALLLNGSSWTNPKNTATVKVGNILLADRANKPELATGYQKTAFAVAEIQPILGHIEISKKGDGPAFGAMYWQHFEPLDRVIPSASGTPGTGAAGAGPSGLSIQKTLYVQRDTDSGPKISPVSSASALKPGDLVKVRLVLTSDRVMEYVHLKDGRASGFEPIAVLSGYKYQNGLGYYEAPRDASTDFFMEYLPKGTHVFEYDLRVVHGGDFSAGVAMVQCFYAPEFAARSAGERIRVK